MSEVIVTTSDTMPENYEILGPVSGSSAHTVNVIRDFFAALRDFFGGSSKSYGNMAQEASASAVEMMAERAGKANATHVVAMRIEQVAVGKTVIATAYGTAVKEIR